LKRTISASRAQISEAFLIRAAQVVQTGGCQTKPVSGLLGGEEGGCCGVLIVEHDANERAVQRESQMWKLFRRSEHLNVVTK